MVPLEDFTDANRVLVFANALSGGQRAVGSGTKEETSADPSKKLNHTKTSVAIAVDKTATIAKNKK